MPTPAAQTTRRIALYYGAAFSIFGLTMPFFNVWLDSVGLSVREIAAVSITGGLLRLVCGPLLAFLADRHQAHRMMLIGAGWAAAAAWFAMTFTTSFWPILLAHLVVSGAMSGIVPLIETIAMANVRALGLDYGRMRLWGSVTFIVASIGGGWLLEWRGIGIVVFLMLGAALAGAIAGHLLPHRPTADGPQRARLDPRDALALMRSPVIVLFLAAAGAVQGAHAMLYVYGPLHWRLSGISAGWAGALWATSVIIEIGLFAFAARLVARWGATAFITAGAVASVVRWGMMALEPPLLVQFPLQALHALTYAASHLGAMHFLSRAVPDRQAGTAQALYAAVVSVTSLIATELASRAFIVSGGRAYFAMAVIALAATVCALALTRRWNGGLLAIGRVAQPQRSGDAG